MHWTGTLLLSVQALRPRPNSVHSPKQAVKPSYSSWAGCSASHLRWLLGWLLAQKQLSWAWESVTEAGSGLVCVLVLLWQAPVISEAPGTGKCSQRRDSIWASLTTAATTLPCHIHCLSPGHWIGLLLQKMGAVMAEITFQKKSHLTYNVSNTIFDIAQFLEMAE